ncbi:amidohydrolase family protein [Photobacterium rosenbergii]|uniref:Amidohydrolase family protein n=1 Tax=Photobacterium rosenbergii TaxID=294936 RepID=A0ABU3ZF47_9GAMM|nr:amidohydrolase family protein [Photobacterium rosenbergii]MDV5168564.1 amidohydrolase family protein [Photobacterium rosenbergii]
MKSLVNLLLLSLLLTTASFSFAENKIILIKNANVFDGEKKDLHMGVDVLVENNLIKTIGTGLVHEKADVIDAQGKFLMPGLIDAHWHTTYAYTPARVLMMNAGDMSEVAIRSMKGAEETLMRGFTTVRDPGGNPFSIKKLIDSGEYPGHRILPSGPFMSQTSGHADFHNVYVENPRNNDSELSYWEKNMMAMVADGVPEVRKRTREILKYGASQIKITTGGGVSSQYDPLDVSEYSVDEIKAVVEEAKNYNTYVIAHVMTDKGIRTSVEAGVMSIEHGFFASDDTLKLMKEKGAWLSPQAMFEEDMQWASPISAKKYKQVTDAVNTLYKRAKEIGVNVAFGTDQLLDATKAKQQSTLLVRMGTWFTNYEVLKMATSDNARLLELSGERHPYQEGPLGRIVEGAYADLLIIDGNPMENLELMGDPEVNFKLIMKDGVVYKNTL